MAHYMYMQYAIYIARGMVNLNLARPFMNASPAPQTLLHPRGYTAIRRGEQTMVGTK